MRKAKKCTRYVTLGTLTKSGRVGTNKVAFTGRLKGKLLALGAYRFSITATDAAGNASSRTITFTVVEARKTKG